MGKFKELDIERREANYNDGYSDAYRAFRNGVSESEVLVQAVNTSVNQDYQSGVRACVLNNTRFPIKKKTSFWNSIKKLLRL